MDILTHIQKINLGDLVVLILAGVKLWDISKRFIAEITGQHDERREMKNLKKMVLDHDTQLEEMRGEHAKDRAFLAGKITALCE